MPTRSLRPTSTPLCPRAQPSTSPCRRAFRAQFGLPRAVSSSAPSKDRVRRSPGRSVCSFATQALRYTVLIPGRCRTSWGFGYLTSSARTRSTSAITNRQSMATVINKRIQDDRSSIRPHLLCVSTARRSLVTACAGPGRQVFVAWVVGSTAQSSEPIRSATVPTHAKEAQTVYCLAAARSAGLHHIPFPKGKPIPARISSEDGSRKLLQQSISKVNDKNYLSAGMAIGFTLPQSGPLYTDTEFEVHSTGPDLGPICMVPTK